MKWTMVLLALAASTGDAGRIKEKSTNAIEQARQDLKRARPALQETGGAEKVMDLSSKDVHFRKMHAHRISCPLIGSFYRKGWLNPDMYGRVESAEMYSALRKSGTSVVSAFFQASGIVSYNETDFEQTQRNRDPGFGTFWRNHDATKGRYVNIFRMNPGDYINSQHVQHGISTTIRDGRYDDMAKPVRVKEGEGLVLTGGKEVADELQEYDRVRKLRQQRFEEWIDAAGVLDKTGLWDKKKRMYASGLGKLLDDMKHHGDYNGEFGFNVTCQGSSTCQHNVDHYHPKASEENGEDVKEPLSEWQASLAWLGTLVGFGHVQGGLGKEFLTRDDLVGLLLDSELPPYGIRDWGFKPDDINGLITFEEEQPALKFPRQVEDKQWYRRTFAMKSALIGKHYLDTFTKIGMFADAADYSPGEYIAPGMIADDIAWRSLHSSVPVP